MDDVISVWWELISTWIVIHCPQLRILWLSRQFEHCLTEFWKWYLLKWSANLSLQAQQHVIHQGVHLWASCPPRMCLQELSVNGRRQWITEAWRQVCSCKRCSGLCACCGEEEVCKVEKINRGSNTAVMVTKKLHSPSILRPLVFNPISEAYKQFATITH